MNIAKYYTIKGLKFLRKSVNILGIDVHLLQKEDDFDTIKHNAKESQDNFFKDPKSQENLYHPEVLKFYKDVVKTIKDKNIIVNQKTIADIGCGNGNLLFYFKKEYSPASIYGFDFAVSALQQAKNKIPEGVFSEHDIYEPFPNKYDLVFNTEVLEHLLHPEKALKNMIDATNKGGHLFITVPNGRIDNYKGHINFWSTESWKVFIEKNIPVNATFESGEFNKQIIYALIHVKD